MTNHQEEKMDCFSQLPSLVQTEMIINIESEASIMQLIRASPAMLSHYNTYRTSIMRRILSNILADDTSGEALHNAAAIIYLSEPSRPSIFLDTQRWKENRLSHPFELPENIPKLYRIITRIIMFIEDYITKATDPFPPRAYLSLPAMTSGNGRRFKGRLVDQRSILFTDLTSSERCRLLRGFLTYELLCRVYRTFTRYSPDKNDAHHQVILMLLRTPLTQDPRVLSCIHEYYRGVYGAIFAHSQASWLPDRLDIPSVEALGKWINVDKASSTAQFGLLFPDNLYMDAEIYLTEMNSHQDSLVDLLPCLGLDILTCVLGFIHNNQQNWRYIRSWLWCLLTKDAPGYRPWIYRLCPFHDHRSIPFDASIFHRGLRDPSRYSSLTSQSFSWSWNWQQRYGEETTRWLQIHKYQLQVYRQRAWGLLDDERLYPDVALHFPTMDDLDKLDEKAGGWMSPFGQNELRSRRRSQRWQDFYAGKVLKVPFNDNTALKLELPLDKRPESIPRFFENSACRKLPIYWPDDGRIRNDA